MMSTWSSCAQPNHLDEDEVHLWLVPLAVTAEKSSHFKSILSFNEQERAGRFQRKMDAERYVAARGSLRSLLSRYLAIAPDRLEFTYDALGKPRLAGEVSRTLLSFSVSHCDDLALIGFVLGHKIGVDLERVRTEIQVEDLAERYFSSNEFQRLRSLPADQRREAFYCGWTRKEAYLKGRGEGLSSGLDGVEVSLAPGEPAIILRASDDPDASQNWTVQHLSPAPGYVGAVAVEAGNIVFRYFKWESV
jgi:4'-phosphopantetheinyl transferase